jgi:hypothetical protein
LYRYEHASLGDTHPDDWRRTHPNFPMKYALAIHTHTLQQPNLYGPLGNALHAADRATGPDGVSPAVRACLPYTKLLDCALAEAVLVFGPFIGQVFRGVKFAFPTPTVAEHNPVAYFPRDRELHWSEFNSSSTLFEVMYQPWFCGKAGPRTVYTIQSCEVRFHTFFSPHFSTSLSRHLPHFPRFHSQFPQSFR